MLAFSQTKLDECVDSVDFLLMTICFTLLETLQMKYMFQQFLVRSGFLLHVMLQWKMLETSGCPSDTFWSPIYPMSITEVTGSLVTRLVPKTWLSVLWGWIWEPLDLMETSDHLFNIIITLKYKILGVQNTNKIKYKIIFI